MARKVAWILLVLTGGLLLASCEAIYGHDMNEAKNCRYMPTIEECQHEAMRLIKDACMLKCVVTQCAASRQLCAADTMAQCADFTRKAQADPTKGPNSQVSGFVDDRLPTRQTCTDPHPRVHWCQLDQDPRCQTLAMVHEECHVCGFHHKDGTGCPGDAGVFGCKPFD